MSVTNLPVPDTSVPFCIIMKLLLMSCAGKHVGSSPKDILDVQHLGTNTCMDLITYAHWVAG